MRRISAVLFAALVLPVVSPTLADGLDYDRSDLYPKFMTIDFGRDAVYFSGGMLRDEGPFWYALDRGTGTLEQLNIPPDKQHQPGLVITPDAVSGSLVGADIDASVVTGKNVSFDMHIPYCGEGDEGDGELRDANGKKIPVPFDHCVGAGAVEQYGDYLLVGSRYSGEGGQSAVKPVIVMNAKTDKFVKKIPFAASAIRVDAYADQVWMAGVDGIVLLDKDLNIEKRWYFYIGFHPADHRPALMLSEKPVEDEPMADLARVIGVRDMDAWFKAVQGIPEKQRRKFSLYDLHMSNFQHLSDGFNVLFPLFVKTIRESDDDQQRYYAIKTLCGMNDPGVVPFLENLNLDSSLDQSVHGSADMCLRDRKNARN